MKKIAAIDMKTAAENYQYLKGLPEGMEAGARISEEEYKKMINLAPELAGFFMDGVGERIFTGNMADFQGAADAQAQRNWIAYLNGTTSRGLKIRGMRV